jgi:hypothetical protein
MSFTFVNNEGVALSSSEIKTILSDLDSLGEVTLNIYTSSPTSSPGIYLTPSTNLGEVDYPGLNSPHSDYSDLLLMGSNQETTSGLKVTQVENNVEEDVRFSFERGAAYANKIPIPQLNELNAGSSVSFKLKYEANPNILARRFYVGVNIDDS